MAPFRGMGVNLRGPDATNEWKGHTLAEKSQATFPPVPGPQSTRERFQNAALCTGSFVVPSDFTQGTCFLLREELLKLLSFHVVFCLRPFMVEFSQTHSFLYLGVSPEGLLCTRLCVRVWIIMEKQTDTATAFVELLYNVSQVWLMEFPLLNPRGTWIVPQTLTIRISESEATEPTF